MEDLQIPIEANDANWRERCNEKMKRLKNKQFSSSGSPSQLLQDKFSVEKKLMSLELYKSVQYKNADMFVDQLEKTVEERRLSLSDIFGQVTGAGDSLLHVAAHFGADDIAELICIHFGELLLTKKNIKGNTALHVAARAQNSNVIEIILSHYAADEGNSVNSWENEDNKITRIKNESGDTPLHEAVYSNDNFEAVSRLFLDDKTVAHHSNNSGKSPLYIAVQASTCKRIIDLLLEASFVDKPLPSHYGISPLHAAISIKNSDLLVHILDKNLELMYLRDEDGGTPLHYAASTGYLEGVQKLLLRSTHLALEWDTEGHLPIHLACKMGHVTVVKEFLKQEWPNVRDMLTQQGQNILHIAANNGRANLVKHLLGDSRLEQIIINEKDKNGNTALHLASKQSYPKVLFHLTRYKRVDLNIQNNDDLTAYDLFLFSVEPPTTLQENLSFIVLRMAHGELSAHGNLLWQRRKISPKMDWIKDTINTVMLTAILIATVTFAAGFTVPGSIYSSDENDPQKRGMAVLANKTSFQVFMICNTIAMYSSTTGCTVLFWASFGDFYVARQSIRLGLRMVALALVTMSLAFMAAIRLVVSNVFWFANLITIIATIFLSLILVISFPLIFPMGSRKPGLRQMYYVVLRFLLWLHESYDLNKEDGDK